MKKALALILALVMLLSLCALFGCAEEAADDPADDVADDAADNAADDAAKDDAADDAASDEPTYGGLTVAELEATKPNEYMLEKIEAGFELNVGYAAIGDNEFTNQTLGEAIRAKVESYGFTYTFMSADVNTATQIEQIENFVTMGCPIIVVLPLDANQIKETVEMAQDAGSHVVLWGVTADYDTIVVTFDQAAIGEQIAKMGIAWLDQDYPDAAEGSIPTAIMGQSAVVDVIQRTEALTNTYDADPRVNITIEFDNCQDDVGDGFDRMEEAMTLSPDLVLVGNNCVANAIGNNNYVMAQAPDRAPEIGIFTADYNTALEDIYPLVESGGACLRGTIMLGESPEGSVVECVDGIINGEISAPCLYLADLFSNVCPTFEYHYDAREA